MNNSTKNQPIELALADLSLQEQPNIRDTARRYELVESTLRRRWNGQTVSRHDAVSEYKKRLTDAQEEALINQINRLTDRGILSTSRIVRNLAEEMIGTSIGKNWTSNFIKRYQDRITSLYLRNMDHQRIQLEYEPIFK